MGSAVMRFRSRQPLSMTFLFREDILLFFKPSKMPNKMPLSFIDSYKSVSLNAISETDLDRLLEENGLVKQPHLSSKDLLLGIFLYLQAMKSPDKRAEYLTLAAFQHSSFHAALYQLNLIFQKIERAHSIDAEQFMGIMTNVLDYIKVLPVHLTPGFILIAHAYLWLHTLYAKLSPDLQASLPETHAIDFLYNAMLSITIAHKLHDISAAEIHNAYGPHGLRLSNAFGVDDTNKMTGYVFRLFTDKSSLSYDMAHFEKTAEPCLRQFSL